MRVDATAPTAPSVSSSSHTEGACSSNTSGSFSWSSYDSNGVIYNYGLSTSPASPAGPGDGTTSVSGVSLPQGTSYWNVVARDPAGNTAGPRSFQLRVDSTAPDAPGTPSSSTHPAGNWYPGRTVSVSWPAASDVGCGLAGYSWLLSTDSTATPDNTVDGTGTSTSFTSVADGTYYFSVKAIDTMGYTSSVSRPTTPIRVDGTAPAAPSISSNSHPDPNVWYSNANPAFSWSATDNIAVTGFDYSLDQTSGTVPTTPNTTATSTTWANAPNGVDYFHVRARDAAGNTSTSQYVLRVDSAAPSAPANLRNNSPVTSRTVTIAWDAAADTHSGVAGYSWLFSKDTAVTPDNTVDGTATSATSGTLDDLSTYYFTVKTLDRAGNVSATSTLPITVDTRTVPGPPTAPTATPGNKQVSVGWTAPTSTGGVPVADLQYSVETWRPGQTVADKTEPLCSSTATSCPPTVVTGLTNGTDYYFKIYARNLKGPSSTAAVTDTVRPLDPGTLVKTVAPSGPYQQGQTVTYSLTLNNPNADALPITKVTDVLDRGLAVVPSSISVDNVRCGAACSVTGQTLTATALTVPANSSQTIRYRAQVALPEFSVCQNLHNTATMINPYGTGTSGADVFGCGTGLGLEPWWSYDTTDLGASSTASVNAGNGNLVVQATDSTALQARGRLTHTVRRTYNSQEVTAVTVPGSLGAGWRLDLGEADDLAGDTITGSALLVPRAGTLVQQLTDPAGITLVDRDGTRHQFSPRPLASGIDVNGALAAPNNVLKTRAITTTTPGALCVDAAYTAPAGVHLGLWRYVKVTAPSVPSAPCRNASSEASVVVGYAAVRADRLRTEYAATGELLSMSDGAGNEFRYAYDGAPTGQIAEGVVAAGAKLRAIYEPRWCTPTADASGNPQIPAGCRATTLTYAADGSSTDATDPAGRTTRYLFHEVTIAGMPAPVKVLGRVLNPREVAAEGTDHVDYSYQGDANTTFGPTDCGGTALQLCATIDARGQRTDFRYDNIGPLAGATVAPARLAKVTDRRGTATTWSYTGTPGADNGPGGATAAAVTAGTQQRAWLDIDAYGRAGRILDGPAGSAADSAYAWLHQSVQTWDGDGAAGCDGATAGRDNQLCRTQRLARTGSPDQSTSYGYNDAGLPVKITRTLQNTRGGPASSLVSTFGYQRQYFSGTAAPAVTQDTANGGAAVTRSAAPAGTIFQIADLTQELGARGNASAAPGRYRTTYTVDAAATAEPGERRTTGVCGATDTAGNTGLVCAKNAPYGPESAATVATTTSTYDAYGQKITMRTANGNAASPQHAPYRYLYYLDGDTDLSGTANAGGWLKAVTDPAGDYVAFGYDAAGNQARSWDRNATARTGATPAGFDPKTATGYAQTLRGPVATALARPWRYVLSTADPLGNTTQLQVDNHGNVTRSTPPRGVLAGNTTFDTVTAYDASGSVTTITTPTGTVATGATATTTRSYDAFGNVATVTGPRPGQATRISYDLVNRPTARETTSAAAAPPAGSDRACRLIGTGGDGPFPAGSTVCTTTRGYDETDNVLRTTDAEGQATAAAYDSLGRTTARTTPRRRSDDTSATVTPATTTTRTLYDEDSHPVTVCAPRQTTDGDGICDADAVYATHTGYDVAGRPVSVSRYRDASTRLTSTTTYDPNGNVTATTDARQNTTTSSYDSRDRLTTRAAPGRPATAYVYDPVGNRIAELAPGAGDNALGGTTADRNLRITGHTFDRANRLIDTVRGLQVTQPQDTAALTAAIDGAITDQAQQRNVRTRQHYDPDGHIDARFSARAFAGAAPTSPDPRFMLRVVHGRDGRPAAQYAPRADGPGGPLDDETGSPGAQAAECNSTGPGAAGYPDAPPAYPAGVLLCASTMTYDDSGNPAVLTLPGGRALTYGYGPANELTTVTGPDPSGGTGTVTVAKYIRDAAGRVLTSERANGNTETVTYTADGLTLTSTRTASASGTQHKQRFRYDADGNRTATLTLRSAGTPAPHELVEATEYTPDGLTLRAISGGTVTPPTTGTETAGDIVTSYGYDGNGNPTSVTSPAANYSLAHPTAPDTTNRGAPTVNTYTPDNLLLTTTVPIVVGTTGIATQTRITSYGYDDAGRKISQRVKLSTDAADGAPQTFTYFPTDLLRGQSGRSTAAGGQGSIANTYDADGQLASTTDTGAAGTSTITANYYLDGLLRETADSRAYTGTAGGNSTSSTAYAYDGTGQVTVRAEGASSTSRVATTFTRNAAGLPTQMTTSGDTASTKWGYDQLGRVTSQTWPNAQTQQFDRDPGDGTLRSTTVRQSPTGPLLAQYDYTYDELGRTLSQAYTGTSAAGSPDTTTPVTYTYRYDNAGRLSSFTDARGTRTLAYDHDGNRTTYGTAGQPDPSSYTYRADDSILAATSTVPQTVAGNVVLTDVTRTYSYDTFGGVTNDGCSTYTYDGLDRLVTTANGTGTLTGCATNPGTSYTYDGLDRQATRRTGTATRTALHYDGLTSSLLRQAGATSTAYRSDVNGNVTAVIAGSTTEFLAHDGTGSTGLITGTDGSVTCTARYDAYGNPDGNTSTAATSPCNTGTANTDIFYRGQRRDADLGTYQLGSRTYDPTKASFLTPDTFRAAGNDANVGLGIDPLTRNTYSYVNGDPINYIDPSGHYRCSAQEYRDGECVEKYEDNQRGWTAARARGRAAAQREALRALRERFEGVSAPSDLNRLLLGPVVGGIASGGAASAAAAKLHIVLRQPSLLTLLSPEQVLAEIGTDLPQGYEIVRMGQGRNAGSGLLIRGDGPAGIGSFRLQWSPGSSRPDHFRGSPYWVANSSRGQARVAAGKSEYWTARGPAEGVIQRMRELGAFSRPGPASTQFRGGASAMARGTSGLGESLRLLGALGFLASIVDYSVHQEQYLSPSVPAISYPCTFVLEEADGRYGCYY